MDQRSFLRGTMQLTRTTAIRGFVTLVACLCPGMSGNALAQEIRISAAYSMQPFSPALEKVVRSAGFSPHITFYPGERSFRMLTNGDVDAEFTRTKPAIASIQEHVSLVGPIACVEGVAFSRTDGAIHISNVQDLQNLKVGIPSVHKTALIFSEKNRLNVEIVPKRESVFLMLNAGRIDVAIDARLDGHIVLQNEKLDGKISETGPVLFSEPTYMVINNRHKDWAARLQKTFDLVIRERSWQAAIGAINTTAGIPKDMGLTCLEN